MPEDEFAPYKGRDLDFRDLLNILEDSFVLIDSEFRIKFANSSCLQDHNAEPEGSFCFQVLESRPEPCSAPHWTCPLPRVMATGLPVSFVYPLNYQHSSAARPVSGPDQADPVTRYIKVSMYPLRNGHGEITAVAELRRDVTAERELENQILRRHHHLQALNRISMAVSQLGDIESVLMVSLDAVLEIVNGEIGGMLLYDAESDMLGYRVYRGMSAKYAESMRLSPGEGIAGIVAQTGIPILLEDVSKDPRVTHRDLVNTEGLRGFASVPLKTREKVVGVMDLASHLPGRFRDDDLYLLSSIGHQIGVAIEQARLYELLARATERYRVLLRHALSAQEEERKRIARELHDETSQSLTSISLSLQAIIGMVELAGGADTIGAEIMDKMRTTHSYAVHAGNEIVRLMKELRPTLLDELGMPTAIRRYAKDTLEPQGVAISEEFNGVDQRFRPEVEVTLFRIAQGVIGNILEHSRAKHTEIVLDCSDDECVLRISDDGKGFDVNKLTKVDPSGRGAGLFTMKERVRLVGGSCVVESQPNRGTRVTVRVPIKGTEDEEDQGAHS